MSKHFLCHSRVEVAGYGATTGLANEKRRKMIFNKFVVLRKKKTNHPNCYFISKEMLQIFVLKLYFSSFLMCSKQKQAFPVSSDHFISFCCISA